MKKVKTMNGAVDQLSGRLKESSIKDDSLQILVINVETDLDGKSSTSKDKRREKVTPLIVNEHADIIFMIECIKKDITDVNNKSKQERKEAYTDVTIDLSKETEYDAKISPLQAAVLVKNKINPSNDFKRYSRFESIDKKGIEELMGCGLAARLVLTTATIKLKSKKVEIMFGAWHGPYKKKEKEKEEIFKQFCKFITRVQEKTKMEWLIGGDFNIDHDNKEVKKTLECFQNIKLTAKNEEKIIFFLSSSCLNLSGCKKINKPDQIKGKNTSDSKSYNVIDHFPVRASVDIE